jgi:hypothetical protein
LTRALATKLFNSDVWVGVSLGLISTSYNNTHDPGVQPLIITENVTVWSYADGSPYSTTADYRFNFPGTGFIEGPCMYLKKSTGYSGRVILCDNLFDFICKWKGMRRREKKSFYGVPPAEKQFQFQNQHVRRVTRDLDRCLTAGLAMESSTRKLGTTSTCVTIPETK